MTSTTGFFYLELQCSALSNCCST